MKTKEVVILVCIVAALVTLPTVSAVRIYTDMTVRGVGYLDMETVFNTQTNYQDGHKVVISSRGCGEIVSETEMLELDSEKQELSIVTSARKSYAPITYLDRDYALLLSGETTARNYMVGAVVTEKHYDTLRIAGSMVHHGSRNRSATEIDTEIYGKAHIGVIVRNTEDYHHTLLRVRDDFVGEFTMNKVIVVENREEP
ncbi:hypothetical protein C5S53_09120 [Methanophagales archaeon]|jgi:hypothetical protein|nr:hypothetical protein C5S53_09120 [Methanophagales archaeon]